MSRFCNGSLPANALLLAIGAAAGVGMTVLLRPTPADRGESAESGKRSVFRTNGNAAAKKSGVVSLSAATAISDPEDRARSLRDAGADAAGKDPAEALRMAAGITSEQDRLEFLRGIYAVWASNDPAAALDYAKSSMPVGLARSEVIGIAVNKWASRNPREAWLWTEGNLTGPLQEQAMNDVLISWTRKTPEAAAQWFVSTGYTSQTLVDSVARTYAEQNPLEALDFARKIQNPSLKRPFLNGVIPPLLDQTPIKDIPGLITPLLDTPEGKDLPTIVPDYWGTTNPLETSAFINNLPDGPAKTEAAATLATVWAASDIQGAVKWCDSISDQETRQKVITHIGTTWGAIDPDSALDWLATLPPALAEHGISGAFNSWAATDAEGLREVVDGSASSPQMDEARLALADVFSSTDVGASLDLAAGISSESGRDAATARYFRQWRKIDDISAQAWLTQNWNQLAPSTKIRLTQEQRRTVVSR